MLEDFKSTFLADLILLLSSDLLRILKERSAKHLIVETYTECQQNAFFLFDHGLPLFEHLAYFFGNVDDL